MSARFSIGGAAWRALGFGCGLLFFNWLAERAETLPYHLPIWFVPGACALALYVGLRER